MTQNHGSRSEGVPVDPGRFHEVDSDEFGFATLVCNLTPGLKTDKPIHLHDGFLSLAQPRGDETVVLVGDASERFPQSLRKTSADVPVGESHVRCSRLSRPEERPQREHER